MMNKIVKFKIKTRSSDGTGNRVRQINFLSLFKIDISFIMMFCINFDLKICMKYYIC